jgi:DNA-binding transcriptional LysR family regulator
MYLKRHGTPTRPEQLAEHETLSFSYLWVGDDWPFIDAQGRVTRVRVQPSVHATNGDLLRELAVAGGGIILQPSFIVGAELARGTLVPLLTDWRAPELAVFAVYPSRRHLSSKVRVFIDHLVESIGESPPWEQWERGAASGAQRRPGAPAGKRGARRALRQ